MTTSNLTGIDELPSLYDAASVEPATYARWLDAGLFTAQATRSSRAGGDRTPFVVMMPPPNVTAILHVGHGLNNTVQDVIVRWRRMCGDETLWVPGTDHAGIATQNVVEKQLAAEGLTRFDVGREAFVERTTRFVSETGGEILRQLQAIGASADWSRTAYTLSPVMSVAVREAFVRLFEQGLIYRGHRVIHWCPRCLTSLSDEEAEFADATGTLYHVRYALSDDPSRSITIATTRPETMLADVAVAVHPDDDRYRDLVGRTVRLPVVGIDIPVIADGYADPAFGSGAVKITPAHDANDFEVGRRHDLAMPVVISPAGTIEPGDGAAGRVPHELRGLDRFVARTRMVALLRESGALVSEERHQHAVRHCYRCDTVVEPRLSDQWFVRMEPLARPALAAVRDRRIRILPERWEAVYVNWLEGIRDWNISRQLWWGHRIPVWYCDACGSVTASRTDLTRCPDCGGAARQDEDVLDTWFSSWLFPISTLGWPEQTSADLRAFYPSDVLVTAPEILFFWVARMIMSGFAFMGDAPFHTVYLHGTVRDMQHRKMSKSLGNGIDPLDVVHRYGADALRWTLISKIGLGVDVLLDHENLDDAFAPGRNFATKLWNIGRFLLARVGPDAVAAIDDLDGARLTRADRWILARLDQAIAECDAALGPPRPAAGGQWNAADTGAGLRLNEYAETARRFVWNELADWYLESTKARLAESGADRDVARAVLVHAFDGALRLLQPVVPFITETLWQRLPTRGEGELLAAARWPTRRAEPARPSTGSPAGAPDDSGFDAVRDAVSAIRQIRSDYAIPPATLITAVVVPPPTARRVFEEEAGLIASLARCTVTLAGVAPGEAAAHALLPGGAEIVVPLAGIVDVAKECARMRADAEQLAAQLDKLRARLGNAQFIARARPDVVDAERAKEREWSGRLAQLSGKVQALCGA